MADRFVSRCKLYLSVPSGRVKVFCNSDSIKKRILQCVPSFLFNYFPKRTYERATKTSLFVILNPKMPWYRWYHLERVIFQHVTRCVSTVSRHCFIPLSFFTRGIVKASCFSWIICCILLENYLSSFAVLFCREKVPRVPETLLKKRKSLEQLKAARAEAQLAQKKVSRLALF